MAETKFIKAAAFGGYDKADVDKKLEFLYGLVFDLKNELRETKLVLKDYQSGSDAEKNFETILATERAQITQYQVKNENLSEKNKSIKEELKAKETEISELKTIIEELQKKLSDAELKINSMDKDGADAYTVVFAEAQKSHDNIVNSAKEKAQKMEDKTREFVEEFIIDANNQASKIVYTAEKQAADIIADAKNQSEQIKASSGNFRFIMQTEINEVASKLSEIRGIISEFSNTSLVSLNNAEEIIDTTEKTLQNGGIPVFTVPKNFEPEYPEEPVYQKKPEKLAPVPEKKSSEALDKLQAMAEAIGSGNKPKKSSSGGISLGDLAKQAESLESGKKASDNPAESSKKSETKKGGMSLADLMKQAGSLDN